MLQQLSGIPLLSPEKFYRWKEPRTIADLRSSGSFKKGSLTGAISIPADHFPTEDLLIAELNKIAESASVHLIDYDGSLTSRISENINVSFLEGGYKAFKKWRETAFSSGPPVVLLAGKTGSGKTEFLGYLKQMGYQIINLEEVARHKGSVFGNLEAFGQPGHEQFQNLLLDLWLSFDPSRPVWLEEKSHTLGSVGLPDALFDKMSQACMVEIDVPFGKRLEHLAKEYEDVNKVVFSKAIRKLELRMGTSANHKALHYFSIGRLDKCLELLLNYYDRGYEKKRKKYQSGRILKVSTDIFLSHEKLKRLEQEILFS